MTTLMMRLATAIFVGAGATAVVDLWNTALKSVLGVSSLSYCLLGRWVLHMPSGAFRHDAIAQSKAKPFECAVGWATHYAIGVGLACGFVLMSPEWLARPSVGHALLYGVATVVMPFFVLQPALGLGVASARARNPARARLKSLATHAAYGVGLYVAGQIVAHVIARG